MVIPIRVGLSPTLRIRGLLADADIRRGQILERCPVVLVPADQVSALVQTVLDRYYFLWNARCVAVALGYGSLYNHSYTPNVRFGFNYQDERLIYTALRDIAAGEELFINYNGYGASANEPLGAEYLDGDAHRQRPSVVRPASAGRKK